MTIAGDAAVNRDGTDPSGRSLGGQMEHKKAMAAVLGLGIVGALSVSAAAMAQHSSQMSGRVTAQFVAVTRGKTAPAGPANSMTQSEVNRADVMYDTQGRGHVHVILRNARGERVGQVDIDALEHGGNRVSVRAWDLTPGFHGFHIHAVGVCDPNGAKPFTSAGGHFNPTGSAEGMQAGAFPVLLADADGVAAAEFFDANFKLRELFGASGASIVVHSLPDNYANIPNRYTSNGVAGPDMETTMTGDGGARVACGVVVAPRTRPSPSTQPTSTQPTSSQPSPAPTTSPMQNQPGTVVPTPTGTPTVAGTHY